MALKRYYIDISPLSKEEQAKTILFIENHAWTSDYVPNSKGCYMCTWEEDTNLSLFPQLSQCIVEEIH